MARIPVKLLNTFCQVVESGGFTEAQYALGITQSAVSCRIRDLEVLLNFRLCERGRSGFFLTERGRLVYERARRHLNQTSDFETGLLELRETLAGNLRIGVVDAILSNQELPIAKALERFLSRKNTVEVEIKIGPPNELAVDLIHGSLDLAIAPFARKLSEIEYRPIGVEVHKLYCGASHPLFSTPQGKVDLDTVRQYAICRRTYDNTIHLNWSEADKVALVSNMEAQALLIASGKFLGALPVHYAQLWERTNEIRVLDHDELTWRSEFSIAMRRSPSHKRAQSVFVSDFTELIQLSTPENAITAAKQ